MNNQDTAPNTLKSKPNYEMVSTEQIIVQN